MEISKLDISKIKVPQGYKVIIDPELVEQERKIKEISELEKEISEMIEPTIDELIQLGKLSHPYYYQIKRLEELNG